MRVMRVIRSVGKRWKERQWRCRGGHRRFDGGRATSASAKHTRCNPARTTTPILVYMETKTYANTR
jgi:hypothetical protein